jgi:HEAT repeat protein
LHACGEEQAIEIGLAHLEEPVNDVDPQAFMRDYEKHDSIIRFIGTTGDESCVPVLEDFTREELLQVYRQCGERFKFSGGYGGGLRPTAILALGRLGSESAIPRLKELYESDDIQIRIRAALSLYSLADDSGYELLEHFVNGTEFSLAQFEDFGGAWPWLEVFEPSVVYLRSPGTDELLLESYRSSHFHPRPDYDWADRIQHETYTFARQYERQLLPILVEQLNNRNRATRKYVNALLRRLTDQDFGFRADKYVLQQDESIERWGAYVDDYLAQTAQPEE